MPVSNVSKYFLQGVVEAFNYAIAPLSSFSTVTQLAGANLNQYITVPNVRLASTASSTFAHSSGYSGDNTDINGVQVQLTNWNYQPFDWTDSTAALLSPDAQRSQGRSLGNRLAFYVVKDILSTTSSFTNTTQSLGSAWATVAPLTSLGQTADDAYWPQAPDRSLLLSPALWWKLASNTTTLIASGYGDASMVKRGFLEDYYGFKIVKTHCLPSTVRGLAVNPRAIAVGVSIPTPQAGHNLDEVAQLQNEDGSGLPLQYVRYYDPNKRKMVNIIETLSGKTLLDSTAGYNLLVTNING